MHEAGAGIGGDEVARQERARPGEKAAEVMHRVAGDGAGEVGAFAAPEHVSLGDFVTSLWQSSQCSAGTLQERRQQRFCNKETVELADAFRSINRVRLSIRNAAANVQ